jgi:hypothetical protein
MFDSYFTSKYFKNHALTRPPPLTRQYANDHFRTESEREELQDNRLMDETINRVANSGWLQRGQVGFINVRFNVPH